MTHPEINLSTFSPRTLAPARFAKQIEVQVFHEFTQNQANPTEWVGLISSLHGPVQTN